MNKYQLFRDALAAICPSGIATAEQVQTAKEVAELAWTRKHQRIVMQTDDMAYSTEYRHRLPMQGKSRQARRTRWYVCKPMKWDGKTRTPEKVSRRIRARMGK